MDAAEGRPVVANFATIPHWMFVGGKDVEVGDDPDAVHWDYEQGTVFRDETLTEVADYFSHLAGRYIAGGFHDEHGVWHESGHHYRFAYWEILCEPDLMNPVPRIPDEYWALSASVYTCLWARCLELDVDLVGIAEFTGCPTIVDWNTGEPNARYHSTKLMVDHVRLGDRIVPTSIGTPGHPDARIHAQAITTPAGRRSVILINKRDHPVDVEVGDWVERSTLHSVDASASGGVPTAHTVRGSRFVLPAHASAVLTVD